MDWRWSSWEEYVENVSPVCVDGQGTYRLAQRKSRYKVAFAIAESIGTLRNCLRSLNDLGFGEDQWPRNRSILDDTHRIVIDLIYAGERLLLHNKRLAVSGAAYGFLHQHEILEHWDHYSSGDRIFREVSQLVTDSNQLLGGYDEMVADDDDFIVQNFDIPEPLMSEFRLVRDLFSLGFDDVGVMVAGRGLEGVLRRIAHARKIIVEIKGKPEPACDADFHDLIEVMYRLQWKASGARLITGQTRALLQYLRSIRNAHAHPGTGGGQTAGSPREIATIVAKVANQLWGDVMRSRAKFAQTTVPEKLVKSKSLITSTRQICTCLVRHFC